MRPILLTILFLLFASTTNAQLLWRVKSQSRASYSSTTKTFIPTDSIHYRYDVMEERGSTPMADTIQFDAAIQYTLSQPPTLTHFEDKLYDSKNRILSHRRYYQTRTSDKIMFLDTFIYQNNMLSRSELYVPKYNPVTGGYDLTLQEKKEYSFDTQGRLTREKLTSQSQFNPGIFTSYYAYQHDRLRLDSTTRAGAPMEVLRYHYQQGGPDTLYYYNYDSSVALRAYQVYDHGASGKVDSAVSYYYDHTTGKYRKANVQQYAYTSKGELESRSVINILNSSIRHTAAVTYYNYLPQATGFVKDSVTYGFDHNHPGDTSSALLVEYEYEPYWRTGINNTSATSKNISIYPIPATEMLQVQASFRQQQDIQLLITDMKGSVVWQWSETVTGRYNKQIPLQGFAPGNYLLSISTNDGVETRQFVVR